MIHIDELAIDWLVARRARTMHGNGLYIIGRADGWVGECHKIPDELSKFVRVTT